MENGYRVTENEIKSFLVDLQKRGRTRSTIAQYRSQLLQLKKFLGEEGLLNNARLAKWKGFMQENGLANESINARAIGNGSWYSPVCQRRKRRLPLN